MKRFISLPLSAFALVLTGAFAAAATGATATPATSTNNASAAGIHHATAKHTTAAVGFRQTVEQYIESIHARNGFSRQRMTETAAREFDEAVRGIVTPHAVEGCVEITTVSTIVWGRPMVLRT